MAEAWGSDTVSVLGFLASVTQRKELGSGVFQLGTRSPATIALTAPDGRVWRFGGAAVLVGGVQGCHWSADPADLGPDRDLSVGHDLLRPLP